MQDRIVVLCKDPSLGGLIARTLRYRRVCCVPVPFGAPAAEALAAAPRGVILAAQDEQEIADLRLNALIGDVPVLALGAAVPCLCRELGGQAQPFADTRGGVTLSLMDDALFCDISGGERVMRGLWELTLPDGLLPLATATERVIGFRCAEQAVYAVQYPIERNDPDAAQILYNFAAGVCGASECWDEDMLIDRAVETIRAAAPQGRILCAVSGGVDSAVCAKLAAMAAGDRLQCIFVDTGLFRDAEPEEVIDTLRDTLGLEVERVEARDMFLNALSGVSNSRDKERIASQLMMQVLRKQLTAAPDVRAILTGVNFNDTLFGFVPGNEWDGLPDVQVCEPLRDLFKEEVRRLAAALDLPAAIVQRQPFPGSGLALRVLGSVTAEKLTVLRLADACFRREIEESGQGKRLWQYYAAVVDDPERPDCHAICLRALQAAQNGAFAARLSSDLLERIAHEILHTVPGVTRVVYDLTPGTHHRELE